MAFGEDDKSVLKLKAAVVLGEICIAIGVPLLLAATVVMAAGNLLGLWSLSWLAVAAPIYAPAFVFLAVGYAGRFIVNRQLRSDSAPTSASVRG